MKVLGIGYGRHLFDPNNFEFKRLERCSKEVTSFDNIVFAKKSDNLETTEGENGFTLHSTNSSHKFSMVYDAVRIGSRLIKEKQIEVITTQDVFEAGLVGLILKIKHPEVILQVQEHGDVLSSVHWRREKISNQFRYLFARILLKKADVVRVVSDRTRTYLQSFLGEQKNIKKLAVVIDTVAFAQPDEVEEEKNYEEFVFVTAGRFVLQKNFELMLNAFADAYKSAPNIKLRIFGDGPEKTKIEELIQKLQLSDVVELLGWTSDVAGEMKRADAYLLTSNYEGWARVLIEAALLRLPVVTTDVGCVNEVIFDGKHGLVAPVDDCKSVATAIKKIATDKELYVSITNYLKTIDSLNIPGTNVDAYAEQWAQTLR